MTRGVTVEPGQFLFLDGELYAHGMSLQKINSLIKNESADTTAIQLRVFDGGFLHTPEVPFNSRLALLNALFAGIPADAPVQQVPTLEVETE